MAIGRSGGLDLDLSPLLVHGDADDVADVGRRLLEGAEVEGVQDLADGERVGDVGHHLERPSAASADEGIGLKDFGDEPGPAGRAAAPRRRLRVVCVARRLFVRPLAAHAVGVVRVEVAM